MMLSDWGYTGSIPSPGMWASKIQYCSIWNILTSKTCQGNLGQNRSATRPGQHRAEGGPEYPGSVHREPGKKCSSPQMDFRISESRAKRRHTFHAICTSPKVSNTAFQHCSAPKVSKRMQPWRLWLVDCCGVQVHHLLKLSRWPSDQTSTWDNQRMNFWKSFFGAGAAMQHIFKLILLQDSICFLISISTIQKKRPVVFWPETILRALHSPCKNRATFSQTCPPLKPKHSGLGSNINEAILATRFWARGCYRCLGLHTPCMAQNQSPRCLTSLARPPIEAAGVRRAAAARLHVLEAFRHLECEQVKFSIAVYEIFWHQKRVKEIRSKQVGDTIGPTPCGRWFGTSGVCPLTTWHEMQLTYAHLCRPKGGTSYRNVGLAVLHFALANELPTSSQHQQNRKCILPSVCCWVCAGFG